MENKLAHFDRQYQIYEQLIVDFQECKKDSIIKQE